MAALSPLNQHQMLETMRRAAQDEARKEPQKAWRPRPAIACWRCPECLDVHDDEEDAEECCCPDEVKDEERSPSCPVCGTECQTHREASDCCLWKDLDAWTRRRIADAVEAGSTWADELARI